MIPILPLLHSKVIPWTISNGGRNFIVARTEMNAATLPTGTDLSISGICGKRAIIKNQREYGNQRLILAEWPQANLHALAVPKLACVISGNADYLLGKYCLHSPPGNFILIPRGMPHQRKGPFLMKHRPQTSSCAILHAYPNSQGVMLWLSRSLGTQHINDSNDTYLLQSMAATQMFGLMAEEAAAGQEGCETICFNLLTAFFQVLARQIKDGHYPHPDPVALSEQLSSTSSAGLPGQVHDYLVANCTRPLRVKDAASHLYMSGSHFSRRLRQETGKSFLELLTHHRIERARALLAETDWTSAAIAELIGFKSPSYFLHLFRRQVGCTPGDYRRHHRQNEHLPVESLAAARSDLE